jgi:hypothetical protein
MLARERLAAAARELSPLRQGDLDSLCGLYAIINAVRLALYPEHRLVRWQLKLLFDAGMQALQRSRRLRDTMLLGVTTPTWCRMSRAVVDAASKLTGVPLSLALPPTSATTTSRRAVRAVAASVHHGHPVLLGLHGQLDHWTVVVRYSPTRLTFFDSAGHCWVSRADLGLIGHGTPHGIVARGIVIVIVRPT